MTTPETRSEICRRTPILARPSTRPFAGAVAAATILALTLFASACRAPHVDQIPDDTRATLEGASSMQVFALDPRPHVRDDESPRPDVETFHGYRILGAADVDDPDTRRRIVELVYHGVDGNTTTAAACFDPRHGIRATLDGRSIDLVICFECLQLKLYDSGAQGSGSGLLTSRSPEPEMTRIFNELGLAIADQDGPKPR